MTLDGERKVLEKLTAAQHAVRHKYRILKQGKLDSKRFLDKTFKPVSEPLKELLELNKESVKNAKPAKIDQPPSPRFKKYKSEVMNDELDDFKSVYDSSEEELENTVVENSPNKSLESDDQEENSKTILLKKDHRTDGIFGNRKFHDGTLKVGGSEIELIDDYLIDRTNDNRKYLITPGFVELLTKKQPNPSKITDEDKKSYTMLINSTNPHKIGHVSTGEFKYTRNKKFKNVIKPLLHSGKGLPKYKVARSRRSIDYVYWDDPNELVERLELLMAEQKAGNTAHINEIHSIIDELRESGYIL